MVPTKTTANSTVWANRSNGQLLTHSNHLGTHLDGEIHFFTPGKDIASLGLNDFLTGPAAVVDLSDATGDYQIYTADPMNTIIRNWMPRQAAEADKLFRAMYGTTMEERLTDDKYQLMHIEMFPYHIIHAQCLSGDIDLLRSVALFAVCNRPAAPPSAFRGARGGSWTASRAQARRPPGRRCAAFVDDAEYEEMMARKAAWPKSRFGDGYNPEHVASIRRLTKRF